MSQRLPVCRIPGPVPGASRELALELSMATRHGLVTGATGTGKTVTLQALAEAFSGAGVPVLCCDVKGDLSGLAAAGGGNTRILSAFSSLGLAEPSWKANPAVFWDVSGREGHPLRATVCDLGPLLMARLLGLEGVQADVLRIVFRIADERGLPVLDLADLRALLAWASDNAPALKPAYGLMSTATLGALQRAVLVLEDTGAGAFFGEPALEVRDLMRTDPAGRGIVNVIAAAGMMAEPALYATVLLHLLGELFEELPELGDRDKPSLVLLLDEAHLLFDGAPKALVEAVERTARLIRSKGVGLWLVTQSPLDIPDSVLGQLGNRVHHALRAYTPRDRAAVDSVAGTLRPNPGVDAATLITELGVGEALVSFLDAEGRPVPVERVRVVPPASRIGPLDPKERAALAAASDMGRKYGASIDRESASELLRGRLGAGPSAADASGTASGGAPGTGGAVREPTIEEIEAELRGDAPVIQGRNEASGSGQAGTVPAPDTTRGRTRTATRGAATGNGQSGGPAGGFAADLARAALTAAGRELGRQVVRNLMGTRRRR